MIKLQLHEIAVVELFSTKSVCGPTTVFLATGPMLPHRE